MSHKTLITHDHPYAYSIGEIVVFQNRWDGVPAECAHPTKTELDSYLNDALNSAMGGLLAGSLKDMLSSTVDDLRIQKKRLVVLQEVDSYSTYNDKANATLDGNSIVNEFEKLPTDNQAGKAFTNLQCQATATNIPAVVAYSSFTANVSNSCLLATKSICDSKTLPWIKNNALSRLKEKQLITIMDDFVDGGLCDLAGDLSAQRFAGS